MRFRLPLLVVLAAPLFAVPLLACDGGEKKDILAYPDSYQPQTADLTFNKERLTAFNALSEDKREAFVAELEGQVGAFKGQAVLVAGNDTVRLFTQMQDFGVRDGLTILGASGTVTSQNIDAIGAAAERAHGAIAVAGACAAKQRPVAELSKGITSPSRRLTLTARGDSSQCTIVGPWLPQTASASVWPISSISGPMRSRASLTASMRDRQASPSFSACGPRSYRVVWLSCWTSPRRWKLTR